MTIFRFHSNLAKKSQNGVIGLIWIHFFVNSLEMSNHLQKLVWAPLFENQNDFLLSLLLTFSMSHYFFWLGQSFLVSLVQDFTKKGCNQFWTFILLSRHGKYQENSTSSFFTNFKIFVCPKTSSPFFPKKELFNSTSSFCATITSYKY